MTILAPTPDTQQHTSPPPGAFPDAFDRLDAAVALQNAAATDCTSLDKRDRQALALLTYLPGLRGITRMLVTKLANGDARLPLPPALAMHLLDLAASILPAPLSPVDRAMHIIAARAARDTSTSSLLRWTLRTLIAEIRHADPSPIPDTVQQAAHDTADQLVEQVRRDQLTAIDDAVAVAL